MRVFIAEKPSMGMDIARALGTNIQRANGYVVVDGQDAVTWCIGHLLSQATPDSYGEQFARWDVATLPIVPEKWKMVANPKTQQQLKAIKDLLNQATSVVHCGDAAREGQLIVDEVLDYFGYRGPAKRLWLQAMNLPAIRAAIKAMKDNREYRRLHDSALARSRADWIMGMNLTRGYTQAWRSKGNDDTLHIGRVQTPTLCMIVARDLEIESFKPQDYFVLRATVVHANGTFTATWQPPQDATFLDSAGRIGDRKAAQAAADKVTGQNATITRHNEEPKFARPPLPFSLGDLQKIANKTLGLAPSKTLEIAQALYEKHKLTSYPRTDHSHLPEGEHGLSPKIIEACRSNFGDAWPFEGTPDFSLRSPAWNDAKIGDHHGIRPTTISGFNLSQLSAHERAIYELIVRNFLWQFYPDYRYEATAVEVGCAGERFTASGTVTLALGWKTLLKGAASEGDAEANALPKMKQGDPCSIPDAEVEAKKTAPPPRFDGASIIEAMEKAYLYITDPKVKPHIKDTGIGTPATRSAIVDALIDRAYITETKQAKRKVYVSSPKGRMLYAAVPEQLRKPDLTAYFEELLKHVESGDVTLDQFMAHQVRYVSKLVDDIKSGKVAAAMPNLAQCEPSPTSRAAGKASKKPAAASTGAVPIASNGSSAIACPKCGKPMRTRNGANGPFLGCTGYPDCRHTSPVDVGRPAA